MPLVSPLLPADALTDGSVAILGALLLFVDPRRHRPRDPQLGGGEPRAVGRDHDVRRRARAGRRASPNPGLPTGSALPWSRCAECLESSIALVLVALVVLITEFASNVATASGIIPVVGSLILATGVDPILLALPAAFAASWGFMLPSGTGPNAIAWATGHIALPRMLKAGLLLDMPASRSWSASVWAVAALRSGRRSSQPRPATRDDQDGRRSRPHRRHPAPPPQAGRARDRRPQAQAVDADDGPRLRSGAVGRLAEAADLPHLHLRVRECGRRQAPFRRHHRQAARRRRGPRLFALQRPQPGDPRGPARRLGGCRGRADLLERACRRSPPCS